MNRTDARHANHRIDGAVPLVTAANFFDHQADIRAGGLTALAPTVASIESYDVAVSRINHWHALATNPDANIRICAEPGDLERALMAGHFGIVMHFQGADPIDASIERLREVADAGVRVMQPTYNHTTALGAGSLTQESFGLTPFGRSAVRVMGEVGVIPDVSHASEHTALDILDAASGVVIASHSNARSLYDHPRNVSDEVIRGIAARGGVIGVCAFPGFLRSDSSSTTADDVLDQAIHIANIGGEQCVSLGLDFCDEDEDDFEFYGYDPKYYPPLPWTYPAGIAKFADFPAFAARAEARGLSQSFISGMLGNNYAAALGRVA